MGPMEPNAEASHTPRVIAPNKASEHGGRSDGGGLGWRWQVGKALLGPSSAGFGLDPKVGP